MPHQWHATHVHTAHTLTVGTYDAMFISRSSNKFNKKMVHSSANTKRIDSKWAKASVWRAKKKKNWTKRSKKETNRSNEQKA